MADCIFCQIVGKKQPAYIVYENQQVLAFLDKHPQSVGHLQLIPKIHYQWVYEIPDIGSFFTTAAAIIRGILPVLGASHVSLATFGSQVTHAHLWIVPHYQKQTAIKEFAGGKLTNPQALAYTLQQACTVV